MSEEEEFEGVEGLKARIRKKQSRSCRDETETMGRPKLWLWMNAALPGERPGSVCWEGVFTNDCGDMWRGEPCLQRWRRRVQGQE